MISVIFASHFYFSISIVLLVALSSEVRSSFESFSPGFGFFKLVQDVILRALYCSLMSEDSIKKNYWLLLQSNLEMKNVGI